MSGPPVDLAANLAEVEARIAAAAKAAGRQASDVTLVAVGKGHGAERIGAALRVIDGYTTVAEIVPGGAAATGDPSSRARDDEGRDGDARRAG